MDAKFRVVYLVAGAAGLIYLIYYMVTAFPNVDPVHTLFISVPDMLFFFLAYKTYPETAPRMVTKRGVIMKEPIVVMQESRVSVNR